MDSFFGIGIPELFLIAIVALIVLGPERLPGAIREIAKVFRTIRQMSSDLTSQFSDELQALDDVNPRKLMREITDDINPLTKPEKPAAAKPGAAAAKPADKSALKPAAKPAAAPPKPAAAKPAAAKPEPAPTEPKPDPEPSILPPAPDEDAAQETDAATSAPLAAPPARNGAGEQKDDAA